jgi:hypothetical protein
MAARSVLLLLGLLVLGGGLAAGASLLVALGVAGLAATGFLNGVRLLGAVLEGVDDPHGPYGDEGPSRSTTRG